MSDTATNVIKSGSLYSFKGIVVRAKKQCKNGMWYVTSHKRLNGFVKPDELSIIPRDQVKAYLANA
jgi:hypothetical protein